MGPRRRQRLMKARRSARASGYREVEGIEMIGYPDASYPKLLRQISDPPPYFWFQGQVEAFHQPCVSIVGTRRGGGGGGRPPPEWVGRKAGLARGHVKGEKKR
ncbi:MAG: DNA-processing protein DprA, partial [Rhodothermales bacterium]|nr:DNA-processing protein DprA [Rhodothermales bacterium]